MSLLTKNRLCGYPMYGNNHLPDSNIYRFGALGTLFNIELNLLAFIQILKSIASDSGMMNEQFLPAVRLNKPITFLFVKPLYFTACHNADLLFGNYDTPL